MRTLAILIILSTALHAAEEDTTAYICAYDIDSKDPHAEQVAAQLQKGQTVCLYDDKGMLLLRTSDGITHTLLITNPTGMVQQFGMHTLALGETAAKDEHYIAMEGSIVMSERPPLLRVTNARAGIHTWQNPPPGYTSGEFGKACEQYASHWMALFRVGERWPDLQQRMKDAAAKEKESQARQQKKAMAEQQKKEQAMHRSTRIALLLIAPPPTQRKEGEEKGK